MNTHPQPAPPAAGSPPRNMALHTTLRGRRLVSARMVWWLIALLAVGLLILSIPARFDQVRTICTGGNCSVPQLAPAGERALLQLGLSVNFFAWYVIVIGVAIEVGYFTAAAIIFWQKSDDWMAIYSSLALALAGGLILPFLDALIATQSGWELPVNVVRALGLMSFIMLWYVFPNGRFVPRWTRWLAVTLVAWTLITLTSPLIYASTAWWVMFLGWTSTSVLAQIYRYVRVSNAIERQQTKLIVLGGVATLGAQALGGLLPQLIFPSVLSPFNIPISTHADLVYRLVVIPIFVFGSALLVPLSFVVAILRYRLWDVDPIINRTLVYGSLTFTLALLYWGSVVVFQQVFQPVLGQDSELALVASTVAVAALVQPLRRRIQNLIDRRFYRRKYDAARILAAFGDSARHEPNLEPLINALLDVVDDAFQPTHSSLWLRPMHRRFRARDG